MDKTTGIVYQHLNLTNMIKTILLTLLGVFFILNGLNHFFNSKILEEYAEKRSLFAPKWMLLISGMLLIFGGFTLISGYFLIYGCLGLCIFLIIASFSIHKFWSLKDKQESMMESMHFTKNWAITFELIYIADTVGAPLFS